MLGELAGEHKADGGLDLSGREGGLGVVLAKAAGFGRDALKDVVDERVHDRHGLLGDTSVGVHLLEDAVDVGGVGLLALGRRLPEAPFLPPFFADFLLGVLAILFVCVCWFGNVCVVVVVVVVFKKKKEE